MSFALVLLIRLVLIKDDFVTVTSFGGAWYNADIFLSVNKLVFQYIH